MSEASQQKVTQTINNNTGQAQAIASGKDVKAIQEITSNQSGEDITTKEAIEILAQIEQLIKTANLPSEIAEEASKYVGKAKEEAREKEPETSMVVKQLERATTAIKKTDTTVGAASELVKKLKPLFGKLTGWLGLAISYFFG